MGAARVCSDSRYDLAMTPDDIDRRLDAMAAEAAAAGDDALLPGLIQLSVDTFTEGGFKTEHKSQALGIRLRGVRVWMARAFENRILSRAEVGELDVGGFLPLEPVP